MNKQFSTLKLFFNKPVLSDYEIDDFEIRRGLITDYEDELNVCFSRNFVFKWLAIAILIVSVFTTSIPISIMAVLSFLISLYFRKEYLVRKRCYKMSISIIDGTIHKKYGLILQPIF